MKNFAFIFTFLIACPAFSFEGKIISIEGRATVLHPHHMEASELKINEELESDLSIITYEKTLVKVSMEEGSVLTIGPNSMIHIQQFINKQKALPGIVSLIRGQVGASINDQTKIRGYKSNFILTTRTAAMGVRGTEFMVSFNEANGATSLVTFRGAVTMAKNVGPSVTDIDRIGLAFNNSGVVVREGEFSAVLPKDEVAKSPEKVNAEQAALLERVSLAKDPEATLSMLNDHSSIELKSDAGKVIDIKTTASTQEKSAVLHSTPGEIIPSKVAVAEVSKKTEAPAVATHDETVKDWYVGLGAGLAKSSIDTSSVSQEIRSRSISGEGRVHNSNRFAWRLFVGHDFTKNWSAELAYLNLGKSSTEFKNVSASDALKLTGLNSISGKGPQLSARYKAYVTEDLAVLAKLGLFHWKTAYNDSSQQGASSEVKLSVIEVTYGFGAEFRAPAFMTKKMPETKLRLDYDLYHMKGNPTHVIAAGIAVPVM